MDLRPAVIALTLAAAFVAPPTQSAAPPEQRVSVSMSTFRFKPDEIKLVHGQPYALELRAWSRLRPLVLQQGSPAA